MFAQWFNRLHLGQKLFFTYAVSSALAMVLLLALISGLSFYRNWQDIQENFHTEIHALNDSLAASLIFQDKALTTGVLAALRDFPYIDSTAVYDENNHLVAALGTNTFPPPCATPPSADQCPPVQPQEMRPFDGDDWSTASWRYITFRHTLAAPDRSTAGYLYLRADLMPMYRQGLAFLPLVILAFLLATALQFLLFRRLQQRVTGPLNALSQLTLAIADSEDYTRRVIVASQDEIGWLGHCFNLMLEQIEQRTRALRRHEQHLEELVAERTAALARQTQTVQALMDNFPFFVWVKDTKGRYLSVNLASTVACGLKREEFIGKTDLELWPEDRAIRYHTDDQLVINQRKQTTYREKIPAEKGAPRIMETWIAPILDESGAVLGTAGFAHDVTERERAEQALREAEVKYRTVAEFTNDWETWVDEDGVYRYVSPACERITGYSATEFLANRNLMLDITHPEDRELLAKHLDDKQAPGHMTLTFRIRHRDGGERWIEHICQAVYDGERCLGRRASNRDVTHRIITEQLLREREESYHSLFESIGDAVFVHPRGVEPFTDCNQSAVALFGYASKEELLKQNPAKLSPPQQPDGEDSLVRIQRDVEFALAHGTHHYEWICMRKDGSQFPASISISPTYYAGQRAVVAIVRDISEHKQMEQAREAALAASQRLAQARSDFLANMSHEIRTPMNAIIGLSHLCLKTELPPKSRDYLQKIHHAGQSLLGILNDILDYSKIEAGKLVLEHTPFKLEELFDDVAGLVAFDAQKKGLELVVDLPQDLPRGLMGDPLRLKQILLNLLSNAVKFTQQGEVELFCELAEQQTAQACLRFGVRDTGIGMAPEQIERIFESFSQADSSTTRQFGGTGLGLTISKKLVLLMGGCIAVESEVNQGSTFSFTLCFDTAAETTEHSILATVLHGKRVLLVDDNRTVLSTVTHMLSGFGMLVSVADSVERALQTLAVDSRSNPFDLVLLDRQLSAEGQTIPQIRAYQSTEPSLRVVLLDEDNGVPGKSETGGADAVLPKPLTPSLLYNGIAPLFGLSQHTPPASEEPSEAALAGQLAGIQVLLVEDHPFSQQVAQELLEEYGMEVSLAENGQAALDKLQHQHFDIVLMDLQMPVMDGYTTTRRLRQDPRYVTLPIIAMTADVRPEDHLLCLAAGMNDHIGKPIDPDSLLHVLARWTPPTAARPSAKAKVRQAKTAQTLPPLAGIDTQQGLYRIGNDVERYWNLLRLFRREHQTIPQMLRTQLAQGEIAEAHRLAHSLTGAAGTIGAHDLQAAAHALEQDLAKSGGSHADQHLPMLENQLAIVLNALAHLQEAPVASPGTAVDDPLLPPALDELERLLKENNFKASRHMEYILGLAITEEVRTWLEIVAALVQSFRFRQAAEALEEYRNIWQSGAKP
jgi:PAS domain S-box-containing protein